MSAVKVFNSANSKKYTSKPSSTISSVVQRMDARRQVLEKARREKVQRICKDIEAIVKREQDYAKQVFEQLVPVKITWNEDALSQLNNIMPLRIENIEKDPKDNVDPEDDDADTDSEDEKLDDTI